MGGEARYGHGCVYGSENEDGYDEHVNAIAKENQTSSDSSSDC